MAHGFWEGFNLTRFVYMCHSNMCYMSDVCVCLLMSDGIMSVTSRLNLNLPLTIVLTEEENRNTTLDAEIMDRYTGLVCLDIHRSIFPEDIKVSM